mgnify:CR=1 FL=1
MNDKISPFHGKPFTTEHIDKDGNLTFTIEAKYFTPEAHSINSFLIKFTGIIIGFFLFIMLFAPEPKPGGAVAAILITIAASAFLILRAFWNMAFTSIQIFEITEDGFCAKGLFSDKKFDRRIPHKISIMEHDKAQWERDDIERRRAEAQLKGTTTEIKRLYTESYHLSFDYMGQPNRLITLYGLNNALAIASRLNACGEAIKGRSRFSDGIPLSPNDDWQSGGSDLD